MARPGVQSARYAGEPKSDARNNAKLIAALQGVADRRAHYACVLVLVRHADDPEPIIADGAWHGTIVDAPRGTGGFGYDPHFEDAATGMTGAELPLDAQERALAPRQGDARADRQARRRAMTAVLGYEFLLPETHSDMVQGFAELSIDEIRERFVDEGRAGIGAGVEPVAA